MKNIIVSKIEKAKEYAKSVVDDSIKNGYGEEIYNNHIGYASQCYKAGYAAAEKELSTQLTAYKEALRELVGRYETLERSIAAHPDYILGDDNDEWHTFLSCGEEVLTQSKTLIV